MSDAILPDCSSAAIYLSHGNKTYQLLAGTFNLYCHTTSIRF
jgi:hypothetical protein